MKKSQRYIQKSNNIKNIENREIIKELKELKSLKKHNGKLKPALKKYERELYESLGYELIEKNIDILIRI